MTQTIPAQNASSTEFPTPPPSRTPALLRRLQVAAALVLLLLGTAGTLLISSLHNDLAAAPVLTEQYARLGQVRSLLVAANTATVRDVLQSKRSATTADAQLGEAAALLVQSARARPADADALAAVSEKIVVYGQSLRAATWPGSTTAVDDLARSGKLLDEGLLPAIDSLQDQLRQESSARYAGQLGWIAPTLTVAVIAALAWISWILAQRSHRALNLGLVGAAVAALIAAGVTMTAHQAAVGAIETSGRDAFDSVVRISGATAQLRASERSLTHATKDRRWGKDDSDANTAALGQVAGAVNAELGMPSLAGYRGASDKLIALLQKSDWTSATKSAVAADDASLAAQADAFVTSAEEVAASRVATAAEAPADTSGVLVAELVVVIIAAVAGAALAIAGIAQRLKEYR